MTDDPVFGVTNGSTATGELVTAIRGDLDHFSVGQVRAAVEPQLLDRTQSVILELRELRFMDSAGVNLLAQMLHRTQADGRKIVLRNPPASAVRVLEITQILDHMVVVND